MIITGFTRLLAIVVASLALALPTVAREEIRAFASDVELRTDGSVAVLETIDVNAEGSQIRRGIYRDIPVTMQGASGNKIRIDLDVQAVTRAGQAEMFRVERMGDFQRIWIGDPDVLIGFGVHRYTISYTMDRMARPTKKGDELYWNATGNYWDFPILTSVARVRLPGGAVLKDIAAYTGVVGSTERDVAITRESDTTAIFRTQRPLASGEGMSFAVSFQKGVVAYPEGMAALLQAASDLREVWLPVLAVILLLVYSFAAWMRVGRDPPKGTIIPLFHPPRDFSPALTHYVNKWGFANSGWTAMTAAIFNLGVKGLVTIRNPDKTLTVATTGRKPDTKLPVGEQVLYGYFSSRGAVTFDKANGRDLDSKRTEFVGAIESENRKVWFNHNWGFAGFGFVLAALMILGMVVLDVLEPIWLFVALFGGVFVGVVAGVLFSTIKSGGLFQRFMTIIFIGVFAFNMGGGLLETFTGVTINSAALAAGSMVVICVIFTVLMRAPTVQGRKVMDEIDGFRLYLETAEKNRLNIVDEPPMTIARFERILPYAIALEVEKPWAEHFEAELKRNAVSDEQASYSPSWYSGSRNFSSGGISRAVATASSGMAAAMVAAQPVQASSSGSGGGGSSGGGGGGGGGGGW
ncbi:DUF2207 domain-containing protein [Devosia sp. XJ19-1]|uniref:DUF2207 domain-containing protein n=1 Tax=Devosia ureilytica TaxID=2952754 RepID=A0A9Q4AQF3_9HYPH|nr:DUF2207 domain-containing protein [Devosia ureilytica]MCP8885005.1 DUF2207 domain-containing protein [Devosia ureilytica]MCP8888484.1 DUF2207 domain-containing protein [Devosia ureilytica]